MRPAILNFATATDMRGLIRSTIALGAAGLVGIAIIAKWPIAIPEHLGMIAGDAYRGAYLARTSGCIACHTNAASGGAALAGGAPLDTPFGAFVPPNLTPDPVGGIGGWTLDQFAVAVRQGVRPDGKALYPAFTYEFYADFSDQDIADLWAAFQTVPPVTEAAAEHDLMFPFNMRWGLKLWRAAYMSPAIISPVFGKSEAWNRGQQLVTGAAHCAACHTGRNMLGGLQADEALAGNANLPGGSAAPPILASVLTAKGWTVPNMAYALRTGVMPDGDVFGGSMAEVVQAGTSFLDDADRTAIATYLLDLPARAAPPDIPVADAGTAAMVHTPGMVME